MFSMLMGVRCRRTHLNFASIIRFRYARSREPALRPKVKGKVHPRTLFALSSIAVVFSSILLKFNLDEYLILTIICR
jgi:hypothetical protein